MPAWSPWVGISLLALACTPQIGTSCQLSTDCSVLGDRVCDTSEPGGYCTIVNCDPDTCPTEADCVAFEQVADPYCPNSPGNYRLRTTFCLYACQHNGDCRGGYVCALQPDLGTQWGGVVIDQQPTHPGVCVPPYSTPAPVPPASASNVCSRDMMPPDVPYTDGGLDGSASAGTAGEAGSAGSAGSSGSAGTSGAAGMSGNGGFSGAAGMSGNGGFSGAAGMSGNGGFSGAAGMSGNGGVSGAAGMSGNGGVSGAAGMSGNGGLSGAAGMSGNGGLSGAAGAGGSGGSM